MRIFFAAVVGLFATAGVYLFAAQPSQACSWSYSYCSSNYRGLLLYTGGHIRAEIDTTTDRNNVNVKDFWNWRGDVQYIQAPLRDRDTRDGDSVYVRTDYYTNGDYCYLSGIGVSVGEGGGGFSWSQSCGTGWHSRYSDYESKHISDPNWWFMRTWERVDPKANSMRAVVRPCQDEWWVRDECGGYRVLGISY